MGNTPSVEVSGSRSKSPQRLSKPRIGNPSAAGLLSVNGLSDKLHISASARRRGRHFSMPPVPSSPPSVHNIDANNLAVEELEEAFPETDSPLPERIGSPLLQSDSSAVIPRQRSQSIELTARSSRGRRMSRTDECYIELDEHEEIELCIASPLSPTPSRLSLNCDYLSCDAKHFPSLAEEPTFGNRSVASESHLQTELSRRQSLSSYHRQVLPGAEVVMPRTSSDLSLYIPMRRRSLLTPGVATRPPPADPSSSSKSRHSLPGTSTRHDSIEVTGAGLLAAPRSPLNSHLAGRPHTPCDSEYSQTGAFRHGTLRITNGSPSPATTPDPETTSNSSQAVVAADGFFEAGDRARGKQVLRDTSTLSLSQYPSSQNANANASTLFDASTLLEEVSISADVQGNTTELLPELKLAMAPITISDIEPKLPEVQATTEFTAAEKDLIFGKGSYEEIGDALGVFIDANINSTPIQHSAPSREKPDLVGRSDSGILVSPRPRGPQPSVSMADSGYSSSISTRSISLKQNGWGEGSSSHLVESVSRAVLTQPSETLEEPTTSTHFTGQRPSSSVPEKEQPLDVSKEKAVPPHDSGPSPLATRLRSGRALATSTSEPSNAASPAIGNLSSSISNSSISSAPRTRKRRIERFINGGRAPLTAQTTPLSEKTNDMPPDLPAARAKLDERAVSPAFESPSPASKLSEQPAVLEVKISSKSVRAVDQAKAEASAVEPTSRASQHRPLNHKSSFNFHAISSTITRAASCVIGKNTIAKKSMQSKRKQEAPDAHSSSPLHHSNAEAKGGGWQGVRVMDLDALITGDEGKPSRRSSYTGERASSFSSSRSQPSSVAYSYCNQSRDSMSYRGGQHLGATHGSSSAGQYAVSKTPPPISMRTRNVGYRQVPRSTPTARPGAPGIARNASRESIHSYPSRTHMADAGYTDRSRRSSMGSSHTYASIQSRDRGDVQPRGHYYLNNAQIPSGFVPQPWGYRMPSSHLTPQNGVMVFQQPSHDSSRHSSMTSRTSRSSTSFRQPRPQAPIRDQPGLRHRSSYDGHASQIQQAHSREHGKPQVSYSDHYLKTLPTPQQAGKHPHKAQTRSQGHYRHNSFGEYRSVGPYRVLHSYNSPAYRHAPIWSN
ncbi:hypothetical protein F5Y17DRAFT_322165 [Xylariaceae sp. FL0594]|nr:hypothetical protein F5Y17DRAFT_322165 [Xylariaceae sp. FL0594]